MSYLKDDSTIDMDKLISDVRKETTQKRSLSYIRKDGSIDMDRMLDDVRDEVCWNASFGL